MPGDIQVEQSEIGDFKSREQAPEVIDMATAQGRDGHSRLIDWNTFGTQDTGQNDFLAITFSKDDQPGEVDFRICLHGFADKLVGFIGPFWQANARGLRGSLAGKP